MNPDEAAAKSTASRWAKTRQAVHWSRRAATESKADSRKKEKKDELVFRMLTFVRLNPLGVRGPKDVMVL